MDSFINLDNGVMNERRNAILACFIRQKKCDKRGRLI